MAGLEAGGRGRVERGWAGSGEAEGTGTRGEVVGGLELENVR